MIVSFYESDMCLQNSSINKVAYSENQEDPQMHFLNVLLDHMCCFCIQWKSTSHLSYMGPDKS